MRSPSRDSEAGAGAADRSKAWGRSGGHKLTALLLAAGAVAVVATCQLVSDGRGQQRPLSADEVLLTLQQRRPVDVDRIWWDRLVAAVGTTLREHNATSVAPHHVDMIARSLESSARHDLPCEEDLAFEVERVKWALPRFLSDPPTREETQLLLQRIQTLGDWMQMRLAQWGPEAEIAERARRYLDQWRRGMSTTAASFDSGTALHPLPESQLPAAKDAFERELLAPRQAGYPRHFVVLQALAAAGGALNAGCYRPPKEGLSPRLAELSHQASKAQLRLAQARQRRNLERFETAVLQDELATERADLEAWSLAMSAAVLADVLTPSAPAWSCRFESTVGQRAGVPVSVSRDQASALHFTTQGSIAARAPQRRWLNADVCVTGEDLTYVRTSLNVAVRCPLDRAPAPDATVTHFTDQQWGTCLAGEAKAARIFWTSIRDYLPAAQADGSAGKTGPTDLQPPIGLLPFCSSPPVARITRDRPNGPVRLLSASGGTAGTVKSEGRVQKGGALSYPPIITLELEPRTCPASTTVMASHGQGTKPTEEHLAAPIPAQTRKVVFTLNSRLPGVALLDTAESFDEKGQILCRIEVRDFKPR